VATRGLGRLEPRFGTARGLAQTCTASVENVAERNVIELSFVKEDDEWRLSEFPGLEAVGRPPGALLPGPGAPNPLLEAPGERQGGAGGRQGETTETETTETSQETETAPEAEFKPEDRGFESRRPHFFERLHRYPPSGIAQALKGR
jgi:hypothetical protein